MTTTDCELNAAGFWPRAAAFVLDRALLWAALLAVRLPLWIASLFGGWTSRAVLFQFDWKDILCWALSAAYFVALTACCGATLGKKAMRLRVVTPAGERPKFFSVLYRETVGRYLSGILCIGYIMAAADPQKRALHDLLCDTRVVYDDGGPRRRRKPAVVPVTDPVKDWYLPYRK